VKNKKNKRRQLITRVRTSFDSNDTTHVHELFFLYIICSYLFLRAIILNISFVL